MEEEILEPVAVGVSTPSPAPAPVESPEDTNAFIARINAMTTGEEMLRHMRSLLPGRAARNLGYTFNRVIKVLTNQGLIPPDIPTTSYGIMKKDSRGRINAVIECLTLEKNGIDIFEKLREAIINRIDNSPTIVDSDTDGGGVIVNRWALMAEFYVHASSRDEVFYQTHQ